MNATLVIDGKEFPIEIHDKELQKLISGKNKKTGYERSDIYYRVDGHGHITQRPDDSYSFDNNCYDIANYYSSKEIAENNARADKLMRQLRRFAVEHREKELDWKDIDSKYFIYYDYIQNKVLYTNRINHRDFSNIYFDSTESAKEAIETFEDELTWYFTEYKDSL